MPKCKDIDKILIIGSGPVVVGQGCEFDYSGTQGVQGAEKRRLQDSACKQQSCHDNDRAGDGSKGIY